MSEEEEEEGVDLQKAALLDLGVSLCINNRARQDHLNLATRSKGVV
jgi:hypothetical protein